MSSHSGAIYILGFRLVACIFVQARRTVLRCILLLCHTGRIHREPKIGDGALLRRGSLWNTSGNGQRPFIGRNAIPNELVTLTTCLLSLHAGKLYRAIFQTNVMNPVRSEALLRLLFLFFDQPLTLHLFEARSSPQWCLTHPPDVSPRVRRCDDMHAAPDLRFRRLPGLWRG